VPSPVVDAAPVTRRRRSERTVGAPAAAPEVELFTPRAAVLPPGVVDTRPPGMRMIDIREAVLDVRLGERAIELRTPEAQPAGRRSRARQTAPRAPEIHADDIRPSEVRDGAVRPGQLRRVDIRDGVDLHDGVLDTRPPGLRIIDGPPVPLPEPDQLAPVEPALRADALPRRSDLRRQEAARSRRRPGGMSVPQVGIAGALGLATIAAPLAGALSMPSATRALSSVSIPLGGSGADRALPLAFPMLSPAPSNAVEELRIVDDSSVAATVPDSLLAPASVLVPRASRSNERSVLPGCTGQLPAAWDKALNGRLPDSMLCTLWDKKFRLRADAAVSFAKLNVAYRQVFGSSMCLDDAYRTLTGQYAAKATRGGFAAAPGTSDHGWGMAVDLCGGASVGGTTTYTWLRANASRYGWENPDWALASGSGPYEPWHWEWIQGEHRAQGGD
jgi:zinc D-Ala-D-Ala carboxypeptidase